jgi:hypothetical protein
MYVYSVIGTTFILKYADTNTAVRGHEYNSMTKNKRKNMKV